MKNSKRWTPGFPNYNRTLMDTSKISVWADSALKRAQKTRSANFSETMEKPNLQDVDSEEEDDDFVPGKESDDEGNVDDDIEDTDAPALKRKAKKQKSNVKKQKQNKRGVLALSDEEDSKISKEVTSRRNNAEKLLEQLKEDEKPAQDEHMQPQEQTEEAKPPQKLSIDEMWKQLKAQSGGISKKEDIIQPISNPMQPIVSPTPSTSQKTSVADMLAQQKTVEITEKYDFAGETILLKKTVSAESLTKKKAAKKASSLEDLVSSLDKKKKMGTLHKSRLDWQQFKQEEGIEDELEQSKKNGYLEKQAFLARTEMREWERDRNERMKRKPPSTLAPPD